MMAIRLTIMSVLTAILEKLAKLYVVPIRIYPMANAQKKKSIVKFVLILSIVRSIMNAHA